MIQGYSQSGGNPDAGSRQIPFMSATQMVDAPFTVLL